MSEKLLEISGLSVCYEGEQILNNICFSVPFCFFHICIYGFQPRIIFPLHTDRFLLISTHNKRNHQHNADSYDNRKANDKKNTVSQTVHLISCNWLPFYRPYSFASQTFIWFADHPY